MLILHTSDWHVGRTLHGADLSEATDAFLAHLDDLVRERGVDAVLISGDLFDRAIPPVDALMRVRGALERLCARVPVVIIPGNHDSATRLGFTAGLLTERLRIVSDVAEVGRAVELHGKDGVRTLVYPIPFLEPDLVREALSDGLDSAGEPSQAPLLARSHHAVMAAALRRVGADLRERHAHGDDAPAIAMVHAFVTGASPSDSERDIAVGGVASVGADLFDTLGGVRTDASWRGLSHVAAGHLHRPQDVRGAEVSIRYSGSPLPYSFSEAGVSKSVSLIEVDGAGHLTHTQVDTPVWRRLSVVKASMEELMSSEMDGLADDFLHVTITDDARPAEMVPRVRARFPHALVVRHGGAHSPSVTTAARVREADTAQTCRAFFEDVGGRALTEAEMTALDEVLTAARAQEAR